MDLAPSAWIITKEDGKKDFPCHNGGWQRSSLSFFLDYNFLNPENRIFGLRLPRAENDSLRISLEADLSLQHFTENCSHLSWIKKNLGQQISNFFFATSSYVERN